MGLKKRFSRWGECFRLFGWARSYHSNLYEEEEGGPEAEMVPDDDSRCQSEPGP